MLITELIKNVVVTLFILLAAFGLGSRVVNLLSLPLSQRDLMYLWLTETIGLGSLSVITFLIGMAGYLVWEYFFILLLVLSILGVFQTYNALKDSPINFSLIYWKKPIEILSFIIISTSCFWLLLTHSLLPPHEWDEIAYHLALGKLYVQAGQIYNIPSIVTSNWPLNNTMLYSLALLFDTEISPHLISLSMTILILIGIIIYANKYTDPRVGWIAAVLFITIPLVKRLAGTGLIDVAIGVYGLAAIVAIEEWRNDGCHGWLVLSGLSCGFIAGSKITGVAFIVLVGIIILWDKISGWKKNKRFQVFDLISFGFPAFIISVPWYARSLIFTGNPVFPFLYSIFGGRNWDLLGNEYVTNLSFSGFHPEISRDLSGLADVFWLMIDDPHQLGGYHGGLGTFLPIGFVFCLFLLRWAPRWIITNIFVTVSFFFGWFALSSIQLRYLLPVTPLIVLTLSYFVTWLLEKKELGFFRFLPIIITLISILMNWQILIKEDRLLFQSRAPLVLNQEKRDQWLENQIDVLPVFAYLNSKKLDVIKVLLLPYENRGYYLDHPYVWGHPVSQRIIKFETFEDPTELSKVVMDMGFTHIIDNPNWIYEDLRYWSHDRELMLAFESKCCDEIYQHNKIILYKLTSCK